MSNNLINIEDRTNLFSQDDIQQNKIMAMLSYLGVLVLIPIFAAKDSKFARFHANQGLVLAITEVIWFTILSLLNLLTRISWGFYFLTVPLWIISTIFTVLVVFGIVTSVTGQAKTLPVIGKFHILDKNDC